MSLKPFIVLSLLLSCITLPAFALELGPHPRLYLTEQGAPHVPSVKELRQRVRRPEYAAAWERAKASRSAADLALVYLLSGDTTGLAVVRKALDQVMGRYEGLVERSLAFDWAYGAFSDSERKHFAERLMDSEAGVAQHYRLATVYHNMARGRHMGQTLAMLAAWEDTPRAAALLPGVQRESDELLEILGDGRREDDMQGRAGYGGGWPEGYDYDRHGSLYALQYLLAWRSAGLGDNLSSSNYWRDKILWLLYGTGPAGKFIVGYEDNDWPFIISQDRMMMTFLEGEFRSGQASWWLDSYNDSLKVTPYWEILFSDPSVRNIPPDSLPISHLIPGVGLALLRSSWGPEAAFVHFHCGPWYTYHQHAAQGSFTVYREAPLVIEPGVYDGEVHENYVNWRIRTISHNCITVLDPHERFLGPDAVPEPANAGGQIIQNWTLKPDNMQQWRAQRKMRDTGRITAFLTDGSHDYVRGEAAGAYNPEKVQRWCRQLVFIKPDWIVLCDLVEAASPDFLKTLYIHTPSAITLEGGAAEMKAEGGQRLTAWSLLPREAALEVGGGPGKTFTYGGHDWPGPKAYNTQVDQAWRLEVKAPKDKQTVYLTVLNTVSGSKAAAARPSAGLLESSGNLVKLSLDGGKYVIALDPQAGESYALSGPGISYSISGTVLNNGMPVEGAKVSLSGGSARQTATDYHGRYLFSGLGAGGYRVSLEGAGKSREVQISDHSLGEVNFE